MPHIALYREPIGLSETGVRKTWENQGLREFVNLMDTVFCENESVVKEKKEILYFVFRLVLDFCILLLTLVLTKLLEK